MPRADSHKTRGWTLRSTTVPVLALLALLSLMGTDYSDTSPRYVRTYPALGPTHLTLENAQGDINVTAWSRREVVIRATSIDPITTSEYADGPTISFAIKYPKMKPVD